MAYHNKPNHWSSERYKRIASNHDWRINSLRSVCPGGKHCPYCHPVELIKKRLKDHLKINIDQWRNE